MKISHRYLFDMKEVLFDREWVKRQKRNFVLYEMRREVKVNGTLRYDVTKIYGRMLGKEFSKTFGHYHPGGFPEIYEVLKGRAIFLLQKPVRMDSRKIIHAIAVHAEKGTQVVIPPRYGHVTINPSRKVLVIANIVSSRFSSNYAPYKKFGGACYFFTKNGWVKNENYRVQNLEKREAGRIYEEDLKELIDNYEKIFWLEKPKKFPEKLLGKTGKR